MCTRVLWNTNDLAVLTGRSMDWPESTEPLIVAFPPGRQRVGTNPPGVVEDTTLTVSGDLDVTDEDGGQGQLQPIVAGTSGVNGYGTFAVAADGGWTYTLDNADPAVQALAAGATLSDSITVTSADGSDTQAITITIRRPSQSSHPSMFCW